MEDPYLKIIDDTLTQLDKSTTWIFLTLMVIILSGGKSDEYEFGNIKIPKRKSTLVFYSVLCGLNFQVLKLLQNLSSSFSQAGNKSEAIIKIQSTTWIFNPFCRSVGIVGYFTDYVGFPLLIILWWIGFSVVNREERKINLDLLSSVFNKFLFFSYLLLGLLSEIIIIDLLIRIGDNNVKIVSGIIGIIIGWILFSILKKNQISNSLS